MELISYAYIVNQRIPLTVLTVLCILMIAGAVFLTKKELHR